jgi:hypothetical protein
MSAEEIQLRLGKKFREREDAKYCPPARMVLEPSDGFPFVPDRAEAPPGLLEALRQDAANILHGSWKAFGKVPLKVDDPPKWQFDYLVRKDFQTSQSAFKLDHRAQPDGADIKIIWEPSRWNQLVRLAMAAYLLEDKLAGQKCAEWLLSWTRANQPFTGLNWTSGLETGIRLVQYNWIDALLAAAGFPYESLFGLRNQILPPHAWFTARHRSFGSSANNHLIGELAGLILSASRWPELTTFTGSLRDLKEMFEKEVLAQFAADGGNREQALGYHLFSWEFCWQCLDAFKASGVLVAQEVQERLIKAGQFYAAIKPCGDPWDFGDSDNAYVTPLFAEESEAAKEWWLWLRQSKSSPALRFWRGDFPSLTAAGAPDASGSWKVFAESGYATCASGDWFLRWDFSPLGYLAMAPHGHLDALHVSIWFKGQPLIIDPGTGAYYADKNLRAQLAGWSSHNGPRFNADFPKRRGTFLWSEHHSTPSFRMISDSEAEARITVPSGEISRTVALLQNGFRLTDLCQSSSGNNPVYSTLKFAPSIELRTEPVTLASGENLFRIQLQSWTLAAAYNPEQRIRARSGHSSNELKGAPFESLVSPAFRRVTVAPFLKLQASPGQNCSLQITLA